MQEMKKRILVLMVICMMLIALTGIAQAYVGQGGQAEIDDCDSAWTASANVTATADTSDKKEGTASVKLAIADGFTTGLVAYHDITQMDLSNKHTVKLYIKSNVTWAAGGLQLLLDDTNGCGSPVETINLPAIATTDGWIYLEISLANPASDIAIKSVGLYATTDPGAATIHLDIIEAYAHTRSYWRLNQGSGTSVTDSGGMSNTGTMYNMADEDWVAGKFGNCLDFDGVDDYVRVGTTGLSMLAGTFEDWVNFDNWASGENEVIFSVPSEAATTSANLVGYWRMEETKGLTIPDLSGNGNDGTVYGTEGTAESGTINTLTDTDQHWHPTTNEWAGEKIEITEGTGAGQQRTVASNTANTITVTENWATIPDATSVYRITVGVWSTTGRFGSTPGGGFDGTKGYIDCGNDASLNPTAAIVVEGWIKTNSTTAAQTILAKWKESGKKCSYKLGLTSANKAVFTVTPDGTTASAVSITGNTAVGTGWCHIVGVYNGTHLKIYLNGVED